MRRGPDELCALVHLGGHLRCGHGGDRRTVPARAHLGLHPQVHLDPAVLVRARQPVQGLQGPKAGWTGSTDGLDQRHGPDRPAAVVLPTAMSTVRPATVARARRTCPCRSRSPRSGPGRDPEVTKAAVTSSTDGPFPSSAGGRCRSSRGARPAPHAPAGVAPGPRRRPGTPLPPVAGAGPRSRQGEQNLDGRTTLVGASRRGSPGPVGHDAAGEDRIAQRQGRHERPRDTDSDVCSNHASPEDLARERAARWTAPAQSPTRDRSSASPAQANGSGSPIIDTARAREAVSPRRWCCRQSTS